MTYKKFLINEDYLPELEDRLTKLENKEEIKKIYQATETKPLVTERVYNGKNGARIIVENIHKKIYKVELFGSNHKSTQKRVKSLERKLGLGGDRSRTLIDLSKLKNSLKWQKR